MSEMRRATKTVSTDSRAWTYSDEDSSDDNSDIASTNFNPNSPDQLEMSSDNQTLYSSAQHLIDDIQPIFETEMKVQSEKENVEENEIPEKIPFWRGTTDEIVISGLSGRFPESNNVHEFAEHLYNGDDMVTENDRRWPAGYYDLPRRHGKLKVLNKFDAAFFGVSPKQAHHMDPQLRMLLEVVHEAILDAGVDPQTMRGSKTGVFVGCSGSESSAALTRDPEIINGYELSGCASSMFANRVSYSFDFRGPSFPVDTACSSGLLALQLAVDSMRQGNCEMAIVAGTSLTLVPNVAIQFLKLGMLSDEGKSKSFDADGKGYVRSETIAAIFLQKAPCARRVYATIVHAKSNTDGYKEAGITVPNGNQQAVLLKEVYKEAGLSPSQVGYVEAHGTGTKVGDPQEAFAITEVFCEDREEPLLIGSVKSNMGHAEPASGLASMAKVLISMENQMLPGNLHFTEPNPYIAGLMDGRLKVVTEKTPFPGGYVGINSFGFGGANTHVLLRSNTKLQAPEKPLGPAQPTNEHQKLICFSGRSAEGVRTVLESVNQHVGDPYYSKLVSELANLSHQQNPFHGYMITNRPEEKEPLIDIQRVPSTEAERAVWFIYSGMGSQWQGMARELMSLEPFVKSILASSEAMRAFGVDPYSLLMNEDIDVLSNTAHTMVCITAIQIALTDTLRAAGIKESGYIGHSTGEMACAYADGCLTRSQTMLLSLYRGQSIMDSGLKGTGAMAAIGLTWEETKDRVPKGVVAACHNGEDSVTISGDTDAVEKFVEELKKEDVFAKMVNSGGVPFHSPTMQKVKPAMTKLFKKAIPSNPKRTSRWISSSIPEAEWDTPLAQTSSAEYHVNNAMSQVFFYEALQHIPKDAVVIEIAPTSLLQSILRRTLPNCLNIGLCKAKQPSELEFLLSSFGKLHQTGVPIHVNRFYPESKVEYPVPKGTPMIAPIIKWDHSQDYHVITGLEMMTSGGGVNSGASFTMDPFGTDSQDAYLLDHVIDGRCLFPFTGYVVLAWRALCKLRGMEYTKTAVQLHNIKVHKPTIISKEFKLDVVLTPGDGHFQVLDNDVVAASGIVEFVESAEGLIPDLPYDGLRENKISVGKEEIYKELNLRGYEYRPQFQGLYTCEDGVTAVAHWKENWVTFLDALLQATLLRKKDDHLRLPVSVRHLIIDPQLHQDSIVDVDDQQCINVRCDAETEECVAGGVYMSALDAQLASKRAAHTAGKLHLEKILFVSHFDDKCLDDRPSERAKMANYSDVVRQHIINACERANKCQLVNGLSSQVQQSRYKIQSQYTECNEGVAGPMMNLLDLMYNDSQNCTEQQLKQLIFENNQLLNDDDLYSASLKQRSLKPLIDIAMENTAGHVIKFASVNPRDTHAITTVNNLAISHPLIETEWQMVGNQLDNVLSEDFMTHFTHSTITTKKAAVDFSSDSKVPDNLVGSADILVVDRVLHQVQDPSVIVNKMAELLRSDGFAIVIENTAHYELTMLIDAIRAGCIPAPEDKNRVYGVYFKHDELVKLFEKAGLACVAYQTDSSLVSTAYLLHRMPNNAEEEDTPVVVDIDDVHDFGWIEPVQQAIDNGQDDQKIWLTSTSTPDNGIVGLGLCLREEEGSRFNRCRTIANLNLNSISAPFDLSSSEVSTVMKQDLHSNCWRDGTWGSFRHFPTKEDEVYVYRPCEHAYINTLVRGDLSSLRFVESANQHFEEMKLPNVHLVSIYYAPLNFRDVMLATGRLPHDVIPGPPGDRDCLLGLEFSGKLPCGKRVMGVLPGKALATTAIVHKNRIFEVPESWSLEEAATTPIVFCTAYYALCLRGGLTAGQSVLIHSGTGGVGQAAITVAFSLGCTVYTTVGSQEKRAFLLEQFPQLSEENVFYSRTTEFERLIKKATRGQGVDVVLNSLSDEKLQASIRCLGMHGKFLEIGKFDLANDTALGMKIFLKNITFHGILLDALMGEDGAGTPDWHKTVVLLKEGLKNGVVRPLPCTLYPVSKVEDAFRFMSSGKHTGKVVVQVRADTGEVGPPAPQLVRAVCRGLCHPQHCYIITGGLGGFGLELADWLVNRGCKKLVLTSRNGVRTGYQARCINSWKQRGVDVEIDTSNIAKPAECQMLIERSLKMGPIGGIFHLAMILRDTLFESQSAQNFKDSAMTKYWGTKNLDKITRAMCGHQLKWFVVFSSISSGRGNSGQTNYGWANSTMERVVEQRRHDGYSGIAIQWGAIGDVGVVMDTMHGDNNTVVGGTMPQRMGSCLQTMDTILTWNHPIVSSFVRADTGRKGGDDSGSVLDKIARIVGVSDPASLDLNANLSDLGIDSLMGVEIRQVLEREYNVVLSMKEIRTMTLADLNKLASGDQKVKATAAKADSKGQKQQLERQMNQLFKLRIDVNDLLSEEELTRVNDVPDSADRVFFVHSIEGIGTPLAKLCAHLSVPAHCLQVTPNTPIDALENTANHYINLIRKVQAQGPYRLVGYSYGAAIAFEMAAQLKQAGELADVILLDGSHAYFRTYRVAYRLAYGVNDTDLTNNSLFETEILCALGGRFVNFDYEKKRTDMLKLANWEARVQTMADEVMTSGLFEKSDTFVWACNSLRQKFTAADKYNPQVALDGDVTLIRAQQGAAKTEDVGHDYGLNEVVNGKVTVHVVDGDHDTIVSGVNSAKTAEIIRKTLFD